MLGKVAWLHKIEITCLKEILFSGQIEMDVIRVGNQYFDI